MGRWSSRIAFEEGVISRRRRLKDKRTTRDNAAAVFSACLASRFCGVCRDRIRAGGKKNLEKSKENFVGAYYVASVAAILATTTRYFPSSGDSK